MQPTMLIAALILAFMGNLQAALPGVAALLAAGRELSQHGAAVAVAAAWQGLFIAFGLAVCLRFVPRTSAEHRFALWAAAFAAIVSLSVFRVIAGFPSGSIGGVSADGSTAASTPLLSVDARWSFAITALWVVAALLRGGDLVLHSVRLRRIWKDAMPVDLGSSLGSMPALARASESRELAEVCTTTALQRPSVIGFFRPRILIPDWLFARLTPGELEQIVLHEAEHLRRRDDWTNLFQKLSLAVFPLNPALLLIERRLCREREMACDDGVIRITRAPRAYAACLASLAERGLQRRVEALSLGAWQRRSELVHRVHSILRRTHALGPLASGVLLGVLGCGLVFGSYGLAHCPQLIAFVPARNLDLAKQAAAEAPQIAQAGMASRLAVPMRSGAVHGAFAAPRTARTEAKAVAVLSHPAPAPMNADELAAKRQSEPQEVAVASKAPFVKPEAGAVMAKAQMDKPEPMPGQEWVVLTAWEQVQAPAQQSGLTADYETGAAKTAGKMQSPAAARGQAGDSQASRIVVTQLIFRIVPASSVASSGTGSAHGKPAMMPVHNGWLVLQL